MTINVSPDYGVPVPTDLNDPTFLERVAAMANTVDTLEDNGLFVTATDEDKAIAAKIAAAYAADPKTTEEQVTTPRALSLTPAVLQHVRTYLDEYGRSVVDNAVQIRHLVTNRLLEESQNPDPRIRLKALELLGKHSDVGLFTDRSEVRITDQTTDALKDKLREKLQKLVRKTEKIQVADDVIDVDAEMGISMPENREVWVPENENE